MSLYKERGYESPKTNSTMIARLSVSIHSTGIVCRAGKAATITCGIVSPIIIQNATMPPNAKAHCATEMAMRPDFPKQYSIVDWKESRPLSLEFVTMSRIVQSTVTVRVRSNMIPVRRPACLKA